MFPKNSQSCPSVSELRTTEIVNLLLIFLVPDETGPDTLPVSLRQYGAVSAAAVE